MAQCEHRPFCPLSFGLALGIIWGLLLFTMAFVAAIAGGYGVGFVQEIGAVYVGYHASFLGAVIGMLWGFLDAFVGGVIFVWLYNFFCKRLCQTKKGK